MRRILIIVAILLVPIVPIVLIVTGVIGQKPRTVSPVSLKIWGTEDPEKIYQDILANYQAPRPYATVEYERVPKEDYLNRLLSAWAAGTGPDVFFVPNTWIGAFQAFAVPMPEDVGVDLVRTGQGIFKSTTEIVRTPVPAPTLSQMREQYVDGVSEDVIQEDKIWGLPLALDTLVLYYNKDLLSNAQLFGPATSWDDLVRQIDQGRLTVTDAEDTIIRSGVALGSADNVPYSTELLSLLLLQNGVRAATPGEGVRLNDSKAQTAFEFFMSFSNPGKTSYSWNVNQPNAKDAFLAGKLVYYFGTYADRAEIDNSSINWGVTPMLHLTPQGDSDAASGQTRLIAPAHYSVGMVSKASQVQGRDVNAWNLLYYMARERNVPLYLELTNRLSALKTILGTQEKIEEKSLYAKQLLNSRTWYRGHAGPDAERFLSTTITNVATGKSSAAEALRLLNEQINAGL